CAKILTNLVIRQLIFRDLLIQKREKVTKNLSSFVAAFAVAPSFPCKGFISECDPRDYSFQIVGEGTCLFRSSRRCSSSKLLREDSCEGHAASLEARVSRSIRTLLPDGTAL